MKRRTSKPRFRLLRWGWRLLLLALLAAGWTLSAAALHVVILPGGQSAGDDLTILVTPKNRLSFTDTYVDARHWSGSDVRQHEALVSRLVEAGHSERLANVLSPDERRRLEEMLRIRRGVVGQRENDSP